MSVSGLMCQAATVVVMDYCVSVSKLMCQAATRAVTDYTGLHFLNFFKSQEKELIILEAFFLPKTNILIIFSLHVQISRNYMLNL